MIRFVARIAAGFVFAVAVAAGFTAALTPGAPLAGRVIALSLASAVAAGAYLAVRAARPRPVSRYARYGRQY